LNCSCPKLCCACSTPEAARHKRKRLECAFKLRQKVLYAMTVTNMNETCLICVLLGTFEKNESRVSHCLHTSTYDSIRQHSSTYTSAYASYFSEHPESNKKHTYSLACGHPVITELVSDGVHTTAVIRSIKKAQHFFSLENFRK
jgi:hypothetical protein